MSLFALSLYILNAFETIAYSIIIFNVLMNIDLKNNINSSIA